jgi:hypothetical protein
MASVTNELTFCLDAGVGEGLDAARRAGAEEHERLAAIAGPLA